MELKPDYYGRYVDDMLFVMVAPSIETVQSGARAVIDRMLVSRGLLMPGTSEDQYFIPSIPGLFLQQEKLIIQHFDKNHSRAGLNEFIKQIEKEASDFHFLPADERGRELDACAFDILYEGSANKLRSVIGVRENSTELGRYLARRMIENRLTSEALGKDISQQLKRFGRGKNLLDFYRNWEQIITLLIVKAQHGRASSMLERCLQVIEKIDASSPNNSGWINHMKTSLREFLSVAVGMTLALLAESEMETGGLKSIKLQQLLQSKFSESIRIRRNLRDCNLLRHQWVAWPLLNFTKYSGSLISLEPSLLTDMTVADWAISTEYSPRFIHHDEKHLFVLFREMHSKASDWFKTFFHPESLINQVRKEIVDPNASMHNGDSDSDFIIDGNPIGEPKDKLVVGIANMPVDEKDITAGFDPGKTPNTTWDRQVRLFQLLNLAEKEHCDLAVLPEVSVPFSWLPFMVGHARRSQVGLTFGLEHMIVGKKAFNLLVTVLPFLDDGGYKSCKVFIRPKNKLSPSEEASLARFGLEAPPSMSRYFLHDWRGTRLTVFNCFELSDIKHRAEFREKIDLLIAVEWNKDTRYFSNIVESSVRDLHSYVIQANTSQFGDSRISAPKRSEEMNLAQVSGGRNTTLLVAEIDIAELNDFRSKKNSPIDKRFKPTPSGFDHDEIIKRRANLKERRK